jgi:hypothetical protein
MLVLESEASCTIVSAILLHITMWMFGIRVLYISIAKITINSVKEK